MVSAGLAIAEDSRRRGYLFGCGPCHRASIAPDKDHPGSAVGNQYRYTGIGHSRVRRRGASQAAETKPRWHPNGAP